MNKEEWEVVKKVMDRFLKDNPKAAFYVVDDDNHFHINAEVSYTV